MEVLKILAAGLALALPAAARAHVVAAPEQAEAGAYQPVAFRVGHGCGKAATTAIRVEIPDAVASARPQPRPGWTLSIEKAGERTNAVVWRGLLPDDQFDEFQILFKLPDQPQVLYFPTVQTCGAEESQWTEIPEQGERASHPAPSLTILPRAPEATPAHQH